MFLDLLVEAWTYLVPPQYKALTITLGASLYAFKVFSTIAAAVRAEALFGIFDLQLFAKENVLEGYTEWCYEVWPTIFLDVVPVFLISFVLLFVLSFIHKKKQVTLGSELVYAAVILPPHVYRRLFVFLCLIIPHMLKYLWDDTCRLS